MIPKLLEELKKFTEESTKDFSFPTAIQKGDTEQIFRAPEVHKMRLPEARSYSKYAPYIIIQFVTSDDIQPEAERTESTANIRMIFVVYDKDEETGALDLVNLMERVRSKLLTKTVIGKKFRLDRATGLKMLVYPSDVADTGPYYGGEMSMVFEMPSVEREVNFE